MRKCINISHVNMGVVINPSENKIKSSKKVKSVPKTYQKVIMMTAVELMDTREKKVCVQCSETSEHKIYKCWV